MGNQRSMPLGPVSTPRAEGVVLLMAKTLPTEEDHGRPQGDLPLEWAPVVFRMVTQMEETATTTHAVRAEARAAEVAEPVRLGLTARVLREAPAVMGYPIR